MSSSWSVEWQNQLETELNRYRKRSQNLLNIMLPKHISTMIRSGVTAYGLFEVNILSADVTFK